MSKEKGARASETEGERERRGPLPTLLPAAGRIKG